MYILMIWPAINDIEWLFNAKCGIFQQVIVFGQMSNFSEIEEVKIW